VGATMTIGVLLAGLALRSQHGIPRPQAVSSQVPAMKGPAITPAPEAPVAVHPTSVDTPRADPEIRSENSKPQPKPHLAPAEPRKPADPVHPIKDAHPIASLEDCPPFPLYKIEKARIANIVQTIQKRKNGSPVWRMRCYYAFERYRRGDYPAALDELEEI